MIIDNCCLLLQKDWPGEEHQLGGERQLGEEHLVDEEQLQELAAPVEEWAQGLVRSRRAVARDREPARVADRKVVPDSCLAEEDRLRDAAEVDNHHNFGLLCNQIAAAKLHALDVCPTACLGHTGHVFSVLSVVAFRSVIVQSVKNSR